MPSGSSAYWASDLHGMGLRSTPTRRVSSTSAKIYALALDRKKLAAFSALGGNCGNCWPTWVDTIWYTIMTPTTSEISSPDPKMIPTEVRVVQ